MKNLQIPTFALAALAVLTLAAVPSALACGTCGCTPNTAASAQPDIVDTAVAAGQFETLVAAIQAAGLVDALKGEGPYTVFAPTDAAFAALPEGALEGLLVNPEALAQVLLYHVVEGEVTSADVVNLSSATTLQGQDVHITVEGDTVRINGANVVAVDVAASNGVIHVIDSVILPSASDSHDHAAAQQHDHQQHLGN
jgi:uncharacterized surface protein with fasciclin (FAS1) repeats